MSLSDNDKVLGNSPETPKGGGFPRQRFLLVGDVVTVPPHEGKVTVVDRDAGTVTFTNEMGQDEVAPIARITHIERG